MIFGLSPLLIFAAAALLTSVAFFFKRRSQIVEVPALAISSSDCRVRVRSGAPVWYLVPDGVVQYIAKHGLYQGES